MKTKARQVVEKMLNSFDQQDIDGIVATFSDDAVLIHHGTQVVPSSKFKGKEGARMFFDYSINALEVLLFEATEFMEAGEDKVIVLGREHYKMRKSGSLTKNTWVQIYTVNDGLIRRMEEFATSTDPADYRGNAAS